MQPDIGLVFQASTFCLDLANINQIQMYTCYALYLTYRQPLLPFVSPPVAFHIIRFKLSLMISKMTAVSCEGLIFAARTF